MTGRGAAHGAVTLLNATATGHGCALATQAGATATWTPRDDGRLVFAGGPDDALVQAVAHICSDWLTGGDVSVRSAMPPSRGLKTSSSVAAALIRAAADAADVPVAPDAVAARAVRACREAAITLTGAYDDQVAVVRGGCHLTENASQTILRTFPVPLWHVAIWVPDAMIAKSAVKGLDTISIRDEVQEAQTLLLQGQLPQAMTRNGAAYHRLYEAAGLPVTAEPTRVALEAGALGAGLSGTGPAVAALFNAPRHLRPVDGGTWQWTRVVP